MDLEKLLLKHNFVVDTYYGYNKRFIKEISEDEVCFVRIYSDVNKLVEVEYEMIALTKYDRCGLVSLSFVNTHKKLKSFLELLPKKLFVKYTEI